MKLIQNNPYRTVGLLVGATAREQDRQIKRLKQYIEAEQDPQDDFSFPTLGNLNRTLDSVEEAASKLNLDSDKINAALFWFWNGNPITDEAAFDALKDGDVETAYQIWDKLVSRIDENNARFWNDVTKKNFSAFHNRAVLALITDKGSFVSAVMANIKFIENDFFDNFIKESVDATYKVVKKDIELDFLKAIAENADNKKLADLVKYLNDYNFSAKADFQKSLVQKPIEQIEQKIETAKNKRKARKVNAAKAGQELFTSTANDLTQLKSIVGANDIKYSSVADKVANEMLQCSIDYFNDRQEKDSNTDYAETAMKLAKQAEMLAVGNLTKDRINDSIETLEEMKDRELLQAIMFLKSVKEAYETNEREIRHQVRIQEGLLRYNQSINWSAVEDNIKNSINWRNVNDLLTEILTDKSLKKIKESDKTEQKNEFLELANWLKETSPKSSTISNIIDKYKKIPPKMPFKIISSSIINSNGKPLYAKHIEQLSILLKLDVTEEKSVSLNICYTSPNGRELNKIFYETIPQQDKNKEILGWGNKDKWKEIGRHKLEFSIDNYVIYSTVFTVDLAPSEKLEIELKKAEDKLKEINSTSYRQKDISYAQNKLKEINNTTYFSSEINSANYRMAEIQKFKLFRSSSTKQMQISEQQREIDSIRKKSTDEKEKQQKLQKEIISDLQQKAILEKNNAIKSQNRVITKLKTDIRNAEY